MTLFYAWLIRSFSSSYSGSCMFTTNMKVINTNNKGLILSLGRSAFDICKSSHREWRQQSRMSRSYRMMYQQPQQGGCWWHPSSKGNWARQHFNQRRSQTTHVRGVTSQGTWHPSPSSGMPIATEHLSTTITLYSDSLSLGPRWNNGYFWASSCSCTHCTDRGAPGLFWPSILLFHGTQPAGSPFSPQWQHWNSHWCCMSKVMFHEL